MSMNFAYDTDCFSGKGFLHDFGSAISAFAQTKAHEVRISHFDQNVVDTVDVDIFNLSLFHVIEDAAIT